MHFYVILVRIKKWSQRYFKDSIWVKDVKLKGIGFVTYYSKIGHGRIEEFLLGCVYRNCASNVELVNVLFIERLIVFHHYMELDFLHGVYIEIIICLNNYVVWC